MLTGTRENKASGTMLSVQWLAATALTSVLQGRSLTAVFEQTVARKSALAPAQRGALRDIVSGTLRHLGLIRGLLAQLLRRTPDDPCIESLLACVLYQLEFTRAPAHAVVDQAVEAIAVAGLPWAKGLVNAVLRRYQREREPLLRAARATELGRYDHPDWWLARLRADHPADWERIVAAGNERPLMTLRVNRRSTARDDYLERLRTTGVAGRPIGRSGIVLERPVPVERLPDFAAGFVSVQDHGAQRAAELLAPPAGARVLDACAAPGGKAAHLLELADISLLAIDADAARLRRVDDTLRRLGLSAQTKSADAASPVQWWDGRPFDRILIDAPCSASGVVRRYPDAKWLRRPTDVAGFATQQDRLLDALWPLLAPRGRLLYATCSVFAQENRERLDRLLARQQDGRWVQAGPDGSPDLQLIPNEDHDGFYYGLVERL